MSLQPTLLGNPRATAGWLALATLVAVVIAPPEAYGSGRMFLIVGSTFAFLILSAEGLIPPAYLASGLAGLGLLTAHSIWISADTFRSIEFLVIGWSYYCLFGFFYYSERDLHYSERSLGRRVSLLLILLAGIVSAYGIYQYVFGLEQLYNFVFYSGADEAIRTPILNRFTSQRIFSTFALPGTLWGFLILTLPLHGIFWRHGHLKNNILLGLNALLILIGALLTQSFGLVVGLFVVAIGWLFTRPGGALLKKSLLIGLLMLPIAGAIFLVRVSTYNPVSYRLQNWLSGWEMFVSHPWGAGLNNYAVLYLQHQQLGANETQYAHNTPVQLLAELGVLALVGAGIGLYVVAKHSESFRNLTTEGRAILLALAVWSVHNLIDINVYFASLGTIGFALIALFACRSARPRAVRPPGRLFAITATVSIVVVVSSGAMYLSGELLYRARVEIEIRNLETAAETLALAERFNPFDSSLLYEAGQVSLERYQEELDPDLLEDAFSYFQRAINLSPTKVGPHTGLSLAMSTLNQTEEALSELEIAQRLYPPNRQTSAIRRLIEQRRARELQDANTETVPDEPDEPGEVDEVPE